MPRRGHTGAVFLNKPKSKSTPPNSDASSVLAETRVGGSSRFFGERFVLLMRAARGGVGGFLLLVKKSVMERCCDIVSAREGAGR